MRHVAALVILLVGSGCAAAAVTTMDPGSAPKSLIVTSESYANGQRIPDKHTCSGADQSPGLSFADVPQRAKSLVMVMDDPDAPRGTWLHWTAWNLPPTLPRLTPGANISDLGGREGVNDAGDRGYGGPCPPPGAPHRYFLRVYALDVTLDVPAGARLPDLAKAAKGHVVAWGELMGTYSR